MFITNNHALFYFWWKENLLNYQNSQNIMIVARKMTNYDAVESLT